MGKDAKRRAWQKFFSVYTGPIDYEVRELTVAAHDDLALVHGLNHVRGTLAGGQTTDLWVRGRRASASLLAGGAPTRIARIPHCCRSRRSGCAPVTLAVPT